MKEKTKKTQVHFTPLWMLMIMMAMKWKIFQGKMKAIKYLKMKTLAVTIKLIAIAIIIINKVNLIAMRTNSSNKNQMKQNNLTQMKKII